MVRLKPDATTGRPKPDATFFVVSGFSRTAPPAGPVYRTCTIGSSVLVATV